MHMRNSIIAGFALIFMLLFVQAPSARQLTVGFLAGIGGLGDQSFNDMTYKGLGQAQKKLGFYLIYEETSSLDASQQHAMEQLLARGSDIIVANGSHLAGLVTTVAGKFKKKRFLINDCSLVGIPNVVSTVFKQHEGSFLAGVLAGSFTKTHRIGFIGGVDLPEIHAFRIGFQEGIHYINTKIKLREAFVTFGRDYSGFENPEAGFDLASRMYDSGVDIIFSVAGLTGNGVIQAAKKYQKYVIGVDADQDHMAKGLVLTSMMKRLDVATFNEIVGMIKGKIKPGVRVYGLANRGVSLSPMYYSRHLITREMMDTLYKVESDIVAGRIIVPDYLIPRTKGGVQ